MSPTLNVARVLDAAPLSDASASQYEAHCARIAEEHLYEDSFRQRGHVISPARNGSCGYVIAEVYAESAMALAFGRSLNSRELRRKFNPNYHAGDMRRLVASATGQDDVLSPNTFVDLSLDSLELPAFAEIIDASIGVYYLDTGEPVNFEGALPEPKIKYNISRIDGRPDNPTLFIIVGVAQRHCLWWIPFDSPLANFAAGIASAATDALAGNPTAATAATALPPLRPTPLPTPLTVSMKNLLAATGTSRVRLNMRGLRSNAMRNQSRCDWQDLEFSTHEEQRRRELRRLEERREAEARRLASQAAAQRELEEAARQRAAAETAKEQRRARQAEKAARDAAAVRALGVKLAASRAASRAAGVRQSGAAARTRRPLMLPAKMGTPDGAAGEIAREIKLEVPEPTPLKKARCPSRPAAPRAAAGREALHTRLLPLAPRAPPTL